MLEPFLKEDYWFTFEPHGELWLVSKQFRSGAFGEVYRIVNKLNEVRALKMEPTKAMEGHLCRLKIEAKVLKELDGIEGFPKLYHCGRTTKRNYIVMEHLGPDISRLRRSLPNKRFSATTAMRVSAKVLKRLEALHLKGWIYRDIKPQNFVIGLGENSSEVYILDFGMTRRIGKKERRAAPAAGTFRYMSLRTSVYKEQSYRDDLEAWLYMSIELVSGRLPWSHCYTNDSHPMIVDMKYYCQKSTGRRELFAALPSSFEQIFDTVLALEYHQLPNYEMIKHLFGQAANILNVDQNAPMDWENNQPVLKCASKIGDFGESDYLPALFVEAQHLQLDVLEGSIKV